MQGDATPAAGLLDGLEAELARHPPFDLLDAALRRRFVAAATQVYFAPDELVLEPAAGPVQQLFFIRRGAIGSDAVEADSGEAGDLFPLAAALHGRPVAAACRARGDTFCLQVPATLLHELAVHSPAWADFVQRRLLQWLERAQRSLQTGFAERALAQQPLEAPLSGLLRGAPLAVAPATPLHEALQRMQAAQVGSVLVLDDTGAALGILTRHDLLPRVLLPGVALSTPVSAVMSAPVHTLEATRSVQDAALLMSHQGLRHVPVTQQGRVVGIVSERDLFALQRLSLRQVGDRLRHAADLAALQAAAADIRALAAQLFAQGVGARSLTALVSQLNDTLTSRLVVLLAAQQGLDLGRACWLAFGSEGRAEQTVATDQDNGLVLADGMADDERQRWLELGRSVNLALADCGFPLCRGGVMAGEPGCCRTVGDWQQRFEHWIAHGAPADLLAASIFFDLRPLAGAHGLALPLQGLLRQLPAATPRFLQQMAGNALQRRPPLNWHGGIETQRSDGHDGIDLKLQGTAIFVDAARLLALAAGVAATGTCDRLQAAALALQLPAEEAGAWVAAFEHLQLLRLQRQLGAAGAAGDAAHPNRCDVDRLDLLGRRVLRESLQLARALQQRIALDWQR